MQLPDPGIDVTKAPAFWLTKPEAILNFLEGLPGVSTREIGTSAGGREIYAAEWGPREAIVERTSINYASARAAGKPEAFQGPKPRSQKVVLFVGAAHGTEFEGTVAAVNFLSILSTGKDLRGTEFAAIKRLAAGIRFLCIPFLNLDGRQRFADHVQWIGCNNDYFFAVSQGVRLDGSILYWPAGKVYSPMPPDQVRVLGSYYNDAGINLVYDVVMGGDSQPETTALLRYAREEVPDCSILSHSNHGSLVASPSPYIPAGYRNKVQQLAAVVGTGCRRRGFIKTSIPPVDGSDEDLGMYQDGLLYHACGTLPLVVEFPQGFDAVPAGHDEILDIGLAVLEEICGYGIDYGFRP